MLAQPDAAAARRANATRREYCRLERKALFENMYLPQAHFSRTDENARPAMTEASLLPLDLPEV